MARSRPSRLCFAPWLLVLGALPVACAQTAIQVETPPAAEPTLAPDTGQPGLESAVQALLASGPAAQAHWGIAVASLDGTPLYQLDAARLFRPASTAKLFTTAAAFALLGPQSTVQTALYGHLSPDGHTITGDLTLVGAGDASFGTNDLPYTAHPAATAPPSTSLSNLAANLRARGIGSVAGDVIGDDTLFGTEPPPAGWEAEDLLWGYGALPSALSFGDDEVGLTIAPFTMAQGSAAAVPVTVAVDQLVPFLSVQNSAVTDPAGTEPAISLDLTGGPENGHTLVLSGSMAAGAPALHEHVALDDPARYTAEALRAALEHAGIAVAGTARALHTRADAGASYLHAWRQPPRCPAALAGGSCDLACPAPPDRGTLLAAETSGTLAEDAVFTLKTSANLHAELFLRRIGLRDGCPGAPAVAGARLVRAWLEGAGIAPGDFIFYDGSGLSTKDLVTPRAEVALLAYAARQPWFAAWQAALPVGGVDGTLSHRFKEPPLRGHVFAKTGTLSETRALAGYLDAASGRRLIFSILEDGHMPGSTADAAVMDRVVETIAAMN